MKNNKPFKVLFKTTILICVILGIFFLYREHKDKSSPLIVKPPRESTPIKKHHKLPLKLVAILPLSGPLKQEGIAAKRGIELAIKLANNNHEKINPLYIDWVENNIQDMNFHKMFPSVRPIFLVHMPDKKIVEFSKKHQEFTIVAPACSNELLNNLSNVITFVGYDRLEGEFIGKLFKSSFGSRTKAVILDGSEYSKVLYNSFKKIINPKNSEIIIVEWRGSENSDDELKKLLKKNPEIIWLAGEPLWIPKIYKQLKSNGYKGLYLVTKYFDYFFVSTMSPEDLENFLFVRPYVADCKSHKNENFTLQFKKTYLAYPNWISAIFYDATSFLINRLTTHSELPSNVTFSGVTGTIHFRNNLNIGRTFYLAMFKDGSFKLANLDLLRKSFSSISGSSK